MDKLYNPSSADVPRASEPAAAYGQAAPAVPHRMAASKYTYTPEEAERIKTEWLQPMTMEQINRWMDEAEAEVVDGEVLTAEEANAEIRRRMPWLS